MDKVKYTAIRAENWDEMIKLYYNYEGGNFSEPSDPQTLWIFRGDKKNKEDSEKGKGNCSKCGKSFINCLCKDTEFTFDLEDFDFSTHLEKAYESWVTNKGKYEISDLEKRLIRSFQRKAELYTDKLPEPFKLLEWLALMRHYEAPTRLHDWTYSFFIAVYFAINQLYDCETEFAEVWTFNSRKCRLTDELEIEICHDLKEPQSTDRYAMYHKIMENIHNNLKEDNINLMEDKLKDNILCSCLVEYPKPLIYAVNPYGLNKRLAIQKGVFLFPGDIRESFVKNLCRDKHFNKAKKNLYRIIINVCPEQRNEILRQLDNMNINQETLFPDLGGFAESLGKKLAYPEKLGIPEKDC